MTFKEHWKKFLRDIRDKSVELLDWLTEKPQFLRGLFVLGTVDYGGHDDPRHVINTDSNGTPVSQAIQGSVILPRDKCWGNKAFLQLINHEPQQSFTIGQEIFYSLNQF